MAQDVQNFENHTKLVPAFHFVLVPALAINLLWRIYRVIFVIDKSHGRAEPAFDLLVALCLIGLALAARIFALQAQDRVIRLEEHMRWQKILSADAFAKAGQITRSQLIALRFAPDDELAGLYARVLTGELKESKAIKQAIKNWRVDNHRL